jgi:hypothetical protein
MAHNHAEQTERLLTAPPPVMRLAMILLGFAVFAGANMIMQPRRSEAGLSTLHQPAAATTSPASTPKDWTTPATDATTASIPLATQPFASATTSAVAQPITPGSEALIGTLIGANYIVSIYTTTDGPRYSVASTSGVVLAELLSPTQVLAQFPDLPIEDLRLLPSIDRPGPIMLVDPDDQ